MNNIVPISILDMSPIEIRHKIQDIENIMCEIPTHTVGDACPLVHSFGDGLYVREIIMPPDFLSTTKIHKFAHPAFIMKGTVSILEESGWKKITGPSYFITKAGTKRIVYCHDEVVWVTVHATEKTDINEIEKDIIAKSFDELPEILIKKEVIL